jgi:hypothetical protein
MASGSWYGLRLPRVRVRGADHLRSVKYGTENRRLKLLRAGRGLAWALLLLLILRALGQGLVMGVAGATLVLLLQELVDPTLLFWSVPWEALHLVLSRRFRVNHLWLHRTQDLARESIGRSMKADGFAMADGFVLIGVGRNKQLVQWTADSAWRGMPHEREGTTARQGCKAVRFLVAVWLMIGGLLAMRIWRGIDLSGALLIALLSAAAGHALARRVERMLANWFAIPAWRGGEARGFRLEAEPIQFPEWLWWQGSQGFIVRRVPEEETEQGLGT